MAYQLVDDLRDELLLSKLLRALESITLDHSSTGYGSTSDRHEKVFMAIGEFLQNPFPGLWDYAMVTHIYHNGVLPPHRDGALKPGLTRHHLVLQTNPQAWSYHDGSWQNLFAGGIYVMDPSCLHAAVNFGDRTRIHLVVDCVSLQRG